jgi:hypothetical protein
MKGIIVDHFEVTHCLAFHISLILFDRFIYAVSAFLEKIIKFTRLTQDILVLSLLGLYL